MSVRLNIAANYAASAWSALATLIFAPVFLHYLGPEAYGLVGAYTLLQSALSLLDVGLGPALNRAMAGFTAGAVGAQALRDLLRSVEWVVAALALAVAAALWVASGWLSLQWLKVETLSRAQAAQALAIMGVILALRLVENIYRAGLIGLQKQIDLAVMTIVATTLRTVGAAAVLAYVSASVAAFFLWQAATAAFAVVATAALLHRRAPRGERPARFSSAALRGVAGYAGGMVGVTIVSLLLSQTDKALLLKMRPLGEYGYYTLAVAAAGAILVPVGPINQALLPRLSQLEMARRPAEFAALYHVSSRLVAALAGALAFVLIAYAEPLVAVWTASPETAAQVAPLMRVYVLGTMLNALMAMPFAAQLAHGWTGLTVRVNLAIFVASGAALLWAIPRYGALGACWVWAAINLALVLVAPTLMHRRILKGEMRRWYLRDVAEPLAAAGAVVALARAPGTPDGVAARIVVAAAVAALALAAALFTSAHVRRQARIALASLRARATPSRPERPIQGDRTSL